MADGLADIRPLDKALRQYHQARDKAARPMYDFTARIAAINPPTLAEMALFQALSQRQDDSDAFFGALTGAVPLSEFMSPKNLVRMVGLRGLAKLMLGQARPANPARQGAGQPTVAVSTEFELDDDIVDSPKAFADHYRWHAQHRLGRPG